MLHFLHLLRSILYTCLIMGIPTLIITGGKIPISVLQHPAYQFLSLIVFAYAAAPVIADFAGGHVGASLFFPNRANLDHPTMSHIISLRNKRLYREAMEELRMLTDLHPDELEPYKMLLHLTAHELPDRRMFDMIYRKGMKNLPSEKQSEQLSRYREEHVQHKENNDEHWHETSHQEEDYNSSHTSRNIYVNKKHHKSKLKEMKRHKIDLHSATLPARAAIKSDRSSREKIVLSKIQQEQPQEVEIPKTDENATQQSIQSTSIDTPPKIQANESIIIKGFADEDDLPHKEKQFVFKRNPKKRR
jgi:hypothetical protein